MNFDVNIQDIDHVHISRHVYLLEHNVSVILMLLILRIGCIWEWKCFDVAYLFVSSCLYVQWTSSNIKVNEKYYIILSIMVC